MSLERIIVLANKYAVADRLIRWAGILRYFAQESNHGFTIDQWEKLDTPNIEREVLLGFLQILIELQLIQFYGEIYFILDDLSIQRLLEDAHTVIRIHGNGKPAVPEQLLWTPPNIPELPTGISGKFRALDSWIRSLIQQARSHVIFVAPYFSEAGIQSLETSIVALLKNQQGVQLDWVVSELESEMNAKAFRYVARITRGIAPQRVRVYCPSGINEGLWFHAKFLLVDRQVGYMGSANFSRRALGGQFELGLQLGQSHTEALWELVSFWILKGYLKQVDLDTV